MKHEYKNNNLNSKSVIGYTTKHGHFRHTCLCQQTHKPQGYMKNFIDSKMKKKQQSNRGTYLDKKRFPKEELPQH